jgi:hypothetical protein
MKPLEKELETALLDLYERWKAMGPSKNYFLQMVKRTRNVKVYKGPVGTVRYLFNKATLTAGFISLVRAGKLDWTVEALVLQPKWKPLFSQLELDRAKARINQAKANSYTT